ncbi:Hypothetical protein R9X50_00646400 [Acrodontium crateriforme]|uniref:Uncharacterized protein n=1 Tax=Acrodontium crateriforme TaxID=150365 RepID=A0AAQ3M7X8_9PEZI|nr:Hypothetical protein R9X50_00646400 [Acrodontium crateriforme]
MSETNGPLGTSEDISTANEKRTLTQRHKTTDEETSLSSSNDRISSNKVGTVEYIDEKSAAFLDSDTGEKDDGIRNNDQIIVTGADMANKLLSLRDDKEQTLTFRSIFLATGLSAFQAAVSQIYNFKPTTVSLQGTFIVLVAYFLGEAWAWGLPQGDRFKARWRAQHGGATNYPFWIKVIAFINSGPWTLKEHAICSITASSASNTISTTLVFSAQSLFYGIPLTGTTVVLTIISVGTIGYGLAGILRPMAVWHVESVYWSTIPIVKSLQGLHWQKVKNSKPLRLFWIAFSGMFIWEWFPAFVFPWLNSISIPCLAAMKATGAKAGILTNVFGGSLNNEGLGIFSISLDWQYITSAQTALPLKYQYHQAIGLFICFFAMIGIYYNNTWDALSQPFMSTKLHTISGKSYPLAKVFVHGILDEAALEKYGPPRLAGTFVWAMFIANTAIGALIGHFFLFWGKDVWRAFKGVKDEVVDRHHEYMAKNYKEAPWWWYISTLVVGIILGLVVVLKGDITLTAGSYFIALALGAIVTPMSCLLYGRFGSGIATNNLSKMLGGLIVPGRPVGNLYFACWSHSVIANAINLSNDLKMGEYLKIAPRVMFITQIYGTIIGGFVNYAVMITILNNNSDTLLNGNGSAGWSGATIQGYNTNAASWAMAKYLYKTGAPYWIVPIGLAIGFGLVAVHRIITYFIPRIRGFSLDEINLPSFIQFAGYIPYNQSQTCIIFSSIISGFYAQFYLRNYKPVWFKDYMYMVTGALDGAAYIVLFILSFAVFGGGGKSYPMPQWWGNNVNGYYDWCPTGDS